jgi:phosphoglycolate phosphatase
MTAIPPPNSLDALLARTRHLLLDFDGPICSIFAGLPATVVADRLRKLFSPGIAMPASVADSPDPLEVFAYSATISGELAARVEAEMTELEVTAVATASPTPYVHEVVTACRDSGRSVAVVSNNSARAVRTYLTQHGLDDRIPHVVARTSHDPALLKPSPHLINLAVKALNASPAECALVGDSTTDIEGARLAGIESIGYANKLGKRERLSDAGAGAVITSLADLTLRLRATPAELSRTEIKASALRAAAPAAHAPGVRPWGADPARHGGQGLPDFLRPPKRALAIVPGVRVVATSYPSSPATRARVSATSDASVKAKPLHGRCANTLTERPAA